MATSTTKLGLTKPAYTDVVDVADLNDNADKLDAAVGMTICTSATRPATPWSGQIIFETDTLIPYVWDGSAWQVAGGGGGGGLTISATAPASPSEGDLWWDSDDGKMFVYYNDGTSSQWVDAAGPSVAVQSTAPTGYEGQLWLDDTDGSMYVYYTDPGGGSSSWIGAVSRSGGVLQVVSTTKTDVFSTTSSSMTDVTGLSASITPRSTSSKVLVSVSVAHGHSLTNNNYVLTVRDGAGTIILNPDSPGSRASSFYTRPGTNTNGVATTTFSVLLSPSTTSTLTYKVSGYTTSGTMYVNRSHVDTDSYAFGRTVSTITLTEVAG